MRDRLIGIFQNRLKRPIGIGVLCGILLVFLALFVYSPLLRAIQKENDFSQSLTRDLQNARQRIALHRTPAAGKALIPEVEVSLAVDELTKKGKAMGLVFLSLAQSAPETIPEGSHRVLPLLLEVESDFKRLGEYLGSLDELEYGTVTVQRFIIKPASDKPPLVHARIGLHLHLEPGAGS